MTTIDDHLQEKNTKHLLKSMKQKRDLKTQMNILTGI